MKFNVLKLKIIGIPEYYSRSKSEFVAKLQRLADSIEHNTQFEIQITGERIYVPVRATFNIEHER